MQKLNLVTVVGHNITMLPHMLKHYENIVDEIFVVVYRQSEDDNILDEILKLGIKPYKVVIEPKFNWKRVTELYNEVKLTKPDEWWIVSDDDELQVYPKPVKEMIAECEERGYEFITGGFLDRIGEDGDFPVIGEETNVWIKFPLAGFFRYPMSGACSNKVCVMKGSVEVTEGQHYVKLGENTSWGKRNWKHRKRYPIKKGFIQVHHFKWDSTVIDRMKEITEIRNEHTYWREYHKMYRNIYRNGGKIDINNPEFKIERMYENTFYDYLHWNEITNKTINI